MTRRSGSHSWGGAPRPVSQREAAAVHPADLVQVYVHGPELDGYISRCPWAGALPASHGGCGDAHRHEVQRRRSPTPPPSTRRWRSPNSGRPRWSRLSTASVPLSGQSLPIRPGRKRRRRKRRGRAGRRRMTMPVLGLVTSNYTTRPSLTGRMAATPAACWRCGRKEAGLRQTTPCSAHEAAPGAAGRAELDRSPGLKAVGPAPAPDCGGLPMPCFLAGESRGRWPPPGCRFLPAPTAGAPGGGGLVRQADGPAGRPSWPGTCPAAPPAAGPAQGPMWRRSWAGPATSPAGQLIDRTGVLLGLQFQLAALDELYLRRMPVWSTVAEGPHVLPVRDENR